MENLSQPSEIARETIKRLASRKTPPTPQNYRRVYLEVSGEPALTVQWPEVLRQLLRQWDGYQPGLTQAKKREMLDRVLINFGQDPDQLAVKLNGLTQSWGQPQEKSGSSVDGVVVPESAEAQPAPVGEDVSRLGKLMARYLREFGQESESRWPDLADQSRALEGQIARQEYRVEERHVATLGGLWREILLRAEGDAESLAGLKRLMALLLENLGEMVADDAWFSGQMAAMRAIVSGNLSRYALYDAENSLKELVGRQKQLKGGLAEAKEKLRLLISTFIDRVGDITTSTSDYHLRIVGYSEQIAKADDIGELTEVIDHLSNDMRQIQGDMQDTHKELLEARNHVEEAEGRIHSLEAELQEVSAMVREDQLTGALNRRGLDEAFVREEARSNRGSAPLSIALLDLDHFKKLNDDLGHRVGDQALVHLTKVVRTLLRPMDTLARYGGEEFLILLPNTAIDEAERVMLRLQRGLTKEFFMHDNQRVLITFSAGVAERSDGEEREDLVARADAAMYRAKAHGRNRVELG